MFNDRQKALEALEAELLMEEIQEEETQQNPEPAQPIYRNYSNNYGRVEAYNQDEEDLEEYVEEVYSGQSSSSVKGLVALALALVAGIFVMLAFWAVRYL